MNDFLQKIAHSASPSWAWALIVPFIPNLYHKLLGSAKMWLTNKIVEDVSAWVDQAAPEDSALILSLNTWVDQKTSGQTGKDRVRTIVSVITAKISPLKGHESDLLDAVDALLDSIHDAAETIKARPAK